MFTRETLQPYIEKGLISEQVHPDNDQVRIYNYTNACQFERAWDEVTLRCRGLIINWETGKTLSNPFPKFFNYEEHIERGDAIPAGEPRVFKKYDGWFGILYWLNDTPYIATRGSFASPGAVWATEWFRNYVDYEHIDREITHLFEIIHPEITKIVCAYPFQGLVHLAARQLGGHDFDGFALRLKETPPNYGGQKGDDLRRAEVIPHTDYDALKALEKSNEEGFVLLYPSGLRLKIKFEEYKRLHKIMTGLSAIGIWEMLRDGKEVRFEDVPDEFFNWVEDTVEELKRRYFTIELDAKEEFKAYMDHEKRPVDRREWAECIKTMTHPQLGFAMLDGKDYSQMIWKMIRPHGSQPFKKED